MSRLSVGIQLAWQIAALEAAHAKHQYIEIEHIFVGLCKTGDALTPEALQQLPIESTEANTSRVEFESLYGVLSDFKIDRVQTRRRLRGLIGEGDYEHTEQVVHRSEKCKTFFTRALEIAQARNVPQGNGSVAVALTIGAFPLMLAILEVEDTKVYQVIHREFGVDIAQLKDALKERWEAFLKEEPAPFTPYLQRYGRDLNKLAAKGEIGEAIERTDELLEMVRTLGKAKKNNPLLIGEPGVGKTALVEGLAYRIVQGNVVEPIAKKRIVQLNMGDIVAGTKYRGEFEERLQAIIKEIKGTPDLIVFIDEFHTVVGAGSASGSLDAANILKPALTQGGFTCIGATTYDEYRKHVEKDPALARRFEPITVNEPTIEQTIKILEELKPKYEAHHKHKVTIEDEALDVAVKLSSLDRCVATPVSQMILRGEAQAEDVIAVCGHDSNGKIIIYNIAETIRHTIKDFQDRLREKGIDIGVKKDGLKLICRQAFKVAKGEEAVRQFLKGIFEAGEKQYEAEPDKNKRAVVVKASDNAINCDISFVTLDPDEYL